MKIKLFQIDRAKDNNSVRYMSHDFTEAHGGFNPDIYDNVFDGEVQANNLEDVFRIFNTDERPDTYHGRSLSVSDIVEVKKDIPTREKGFYFCDDIGFKQIEFNETQDIDIEDNDDSMDTTSLSM